ncbi:gamma-glutamylcyclotransferase family protein [Gordonia shandongensis]|uniref:gamma-glutamylcyclotransferase family protein n=1 Tax=Gordonia shandongensis TaxID=376351 RepID=UPI00041BF7AD|nr:gamma-glutamylcyclotransferase family protein [Gordonia shandongensis]
MSAHLLFSYGTLRDPAVQRGVFGRSVPTVADSLPGFRVDELTITDPAVIALSGTDTHLVLRPDPRADPVPGVRLEVDDAGLSAADDYEVDDYRRVRVTLTSGLRAWVYLAAEPTD